MANLLPDRPPRSSFPQLDPDQLLRLRVRLESLVALSSDPPALKRLERELASFEAALEELESATSLLTAQDLLEEFDRARTALGLAVSGETMGGEFMCYWPGRSLSTGEAGVASRGFYDVLDRPPLVNWLEAIARPMASNARSFEVAILVWISETNIDRARLGRKACATGSLALLREISIPLEEQLRPLL